MRTLTPVLRVTLALLLCVSATGKATSSKECHNPISRLLKTRAGGMTCRHIPGGETGQLPSLPKPTLTNPITWMSNLGTRAGDVGADALAGAGAAMVAYTIATPFETIKTVNQIDGGRTRTAVKNVVNRGGKRSLMSPVKAMWLSGVPYSMLLYSVYRPLKAATRRAANRMHPDGEASRGEVFAADLVAAAGAELIGLVAYTPGELVAKRMMADPTRYPGTFSALRSIVSEKGVKGIFTGLGACLARDLPYTALQFAIFDALASKVMAAHGDEDAPKLRFSESLMIGAGAAVVASTATLPIDAIKSQMMLATEKIRIPALVSKVLADEGPSAFFRGLPTYMTINICKWSSSQAVFNQLRGSTEGGH